MDKLGPGLFHILGTILWGDLGPFTMYRNKRGKVVYFLKAPPKVPRSPLQQNLQDNFTAAAAAWRQLSQADHANWRQAAARASLCMTGYNLFVHAFTQRELTHMVTIERQTSVDLIDAFPPFKVALFWASRWYSRAATVWNRAAYEAPAFPVDTGGVHVYSLHRTWPSTQSFFASLLAADASTWTVSPSAILHEGNQTELVTFSPHTITPPFDRNRIFFEQWHIHSGTLYWEMYVDLLMTIFPAFH